jgi:HEAT repeat protein
MQHAVNVASRGDAPILEEFGRPPKALDADSYKTEVGKLARQLQSDDDDVVRTATLGLERGLAYERIPELIEALGTQEDEELIATIWGTLNRLAREVPAKPLEPYLLTREGKLNWHAARVLARSETVSAQFMMGKLKSALSGDKIYWDKDRTNVFLQKLAAAVRDAQEPDEMERFAAALAEGGHRDLAMAVVKRIEATEEGIQGHALRALAYIDTDEAKGVYRRYLDRSGLSYQWDVWLDWPSTLELFDEELAEWILRRQIAGKRSIESWRGVLAAFVSPRMVPLLLEGLNAEQLTSTRSFSARMLGRVGDQSVVPDLLQVLAEEPPQPPPTPTATPETDEEFAESFERMMDPEEHWVVRMNAARALGKIGSPSARSGLESALEDPDEEVRKAARRALDRLPD